MWHLSSMHADCNIVLCMSKRRAALVSFESTVVLLIDSKQWYLSCIMILL